MNIHPVQASAMSELPNSECSKIPVVMMCCCYIGDNGCDLE